MKKSYVYKITCLVTGEYYFGSSFNAKSDRYWGGGRKIRERIAKYGKENFVKEILEEFDDRVEAHKKENEYIEKFRNDDKCLNQMLNCHFGLLYGEESRAKLSVAKRRENLSKESRAKMSAAHLGKHHTDEIRAKMSAAKRGKKSNFFGKHLSEESRAKISAAHRGEKNPMYGKHWRKNPVTGKREYYD